MRKKAVVLTFPGHFLLTKLTIASLQKIKSIQEIVVIVDDISPMAWDTYVNDCAEFYKLPIIQTSNFIEFLKFADNPWVRQQMIKMHLDLIFNDQEIFFTDGDIEFHYDVPYKSVPYTLTSYSGVSLEERDPGPGEVTSQQIYYVRHFLNKPFDGLFHNGKRITTSAAPFRDLNLDILKQLREYIQKVQNKSFIQAHQDISLDYRYSISEWEILEYFKQEILKTDLNFVYYPPYSIDELPNNTHRGPDWFATCFVSDTQLDYEWWLQKNIANIENYWKQLPNKKYN
jgi:hypothetical protein